MAPTEQPVFYFDLGSPYAWLTAERIHHVLPVVAVWQPILLGGIWRHSGGESWAITDKREEGVREVERRAVDYQLLPLKWPELAQAAPLDACRPFATADPVASVAASPGLRRGKTERDDKRSIAAAACELHPRPFSRRSSSIARTAHVSTRRPTKRVRECLRRGGDEVFWGDDASRSCRGPQRRVLTTPPPSGVSVIAAEGPRYSPTKDTEQHTAPKRTPGR